jgi:4-hydroxy-tetrahydrodipicolinate reductase
MRSGPTSVAVIGAGGRLGSRIVAECERDGLPVVLRAGSGEWGASGQPTVVIDASRGEALPRTVAYCRYVGAALVACASDLGADGEKLLAELAETVAVVHAVNLSVGHWLQDRLLDMAGQVCVALPTVPRAAVLERHTPAKRDRPSASACSLAQTWTRRTGATVPEIASFRSGHPVSEHVVYLDLAHETVTIKHDVRDLAAAAPGAVIAARWAHSAPAGLVPLRRVFDTVFLQEG